MIVVHYQPHDAPAPFDPAQPHQRLEIPDEKDAMRVASEIEVRLFPNGAEARRARGERVDFPAPRKPKAPAGEASNPTTTSSAAPAAGAGGPSGVRDTSVRAYSALKFSGKLSDQQREVVAVFREKPGARTRQEIARDAGLTINATCGRCSELLELEVLVEVGKKTCAVTKQHVHALDLAAHAAALLTEEIA